KAVALKEHDDKLFLESDDGKVRNLPSTLYTQLADISDPYDPSKDFIGFVDPSIGVVLVDTKSLKRDHESNKSGGKHTDDHDGKLRVKSRSSSAVRTSTYETPVGDTISNATISTLERSASLKKEKTLHQLAYEKKMGHSPPDDETRPISGFGVKKGKVVFNSTTFNSYDDEFHTQERTMGETEQVKVTALICRLHED
ncbi:hypothetical protein FHG87_015881, partial [Trinorchestia longiramus]